MVPMTRFSTTTASDGVVPVSRETVWQVLTDPDLVTDMTPLLHRIHAEGDLWRWELAKVPVTGISIAPCFTERMRFDEPARIDYSHEPPVGSEEPTGVDGCYSLTKVDDGTHLAISLTIHADLPLPRLAAPAVKAAMHAVVATIGAGFSRNLTRELRRVG